MSPFHHQVLLLEDSDEDYRMITEGLHHVDYDLDIHRFTSVDSLIHWIGGSSSPLSLAFVDLNLPGMSGQHAVRALRNHPLHKTMPMVIFSTSSTPSDVIQSYESGVSSYHVKPLETPKFHQLVTDIATYWLQRSILPHMVSHAA